MWPRFWATASRAGFPKKLSACDCTFKQRFHFSAKLFVTRTGFVQEKHAAARPPFQSQLQELVDLLPAFRSHRSMTSARLTIRRDVSGE